MEYRAIAWKVPSLLVMATLLLLAGPVARAQESSTALTLYPDSPALVVTTEEVALGEGLNTFYRVLPHQSVTNSVMVDLQPGTITSYATIPAVDSESEFLQSFLGEKIRVRTCSGGNCSRVSGTLVKIFDGNPLLRKEDGSLEYIKSASGYQLANSEGQLSPKRVAINATSQHDRTARITLSYRTDGLGWDSSYRAVLSESEDQLRLTAIAHIANQTDLSYRTDQLRLIAGEPKNGNRNTLYRMEGKGIASAPQAQPEELFEYYSYNIQEEVSLEPDRNLNIPFISADGLSVDKQYVFEPSLSSAVIVKFLFRNEKDNNLGLPLPAGLFRVYQETSGETLTYLGSDTIQNRPAGEEVSLALGNVFDILGQRKRLSHQKVDENLWRDEVELTLTNRKDSPAEVRVIERLPGSWKILEASHEFVQMDESRIKFLIVASPGEKTRITYTVDYRY